MRTAVALSFCALGLSCGPMETSTIPTGTDPTQTTSALVAPAPRERTISIVGTNDLHGRVVALPVLGGYVKNLRAARERDGGAVVLVDAGDMFQGTLESNLLEGVPVRDAYAVLGYAAVTVGNHEFDYGPVGPNATPRSADDDPRGALKALAKDAPFPFLIANVLARDEKKRVDYPNMPSSTLVTAGDVRIGIIGVTTEDTLTTTMSSNVKDLAMAPIVDTIVSESAALRGKGAQVIVVLAHAGGKCHAFTNDLPADKCEMKAEIFRVAQALPKKTVDVIVAGHTHAGVAHEVAGIPIIEQFSYGRAFGRVDLTLAGDPPVVVRHAVHAPKDLCAGDKPDLATCEPGDYEGAKVVRDERVAAAIAPGIAAAKDKRASRLGTTLTTTIHRSYQAESALGNLFADLILEGAPGVHVALMNGGGLREDLHAGDLTYGALFEAFPFDNRMAIVSLKVSELERIFASHLRQTGGGILSIAGARVRPRCVEGRIEVVLERIKGGKPYRDDETIVLAASDFMLLGGDGFWGEVKAPAVDIRDELVRDVLEAGLRKRKTLKESDVFDPKKRRMDGEKPRPMKCE